MGGNTLKSQDYPEGLRALPLKAMECEIAHYAMDNDLTLKAAALKLGFVTEAEFDRVVDPKKMVQPYVAVATAEA